MPSDTYILTISDAGVSVPSANSVTNDSVAADAAISFSKLAPLSSGNIIVGNSSNVPTSVAVTGDVTISNTGVTSITTGSIVNADINTSAGIAHSKLATTTAGNVLIGNAAGSITGTPITGDISVSSTGAATINNNAVTLSKFQTVSDYQILGRNTGLGVGNVQSISCTPFAFSLLDDGNASTARTTLGLGSIATQDSSSVNITGGTISGTTISFSTPLSATSGGTGQSSYAVGDLLYANTTTSVAKLADVATGNVLLSGGLNTAPSYGKVGLSTHVTGILPVANGGLGVDLSSDNGFVYSDGSGNFMTYTLISLTQQVGGVLPMENGGTGYSQTAIGELYLTTQTATSIAAINNWYKVLGTTALVAGGANLTTPNTFNNRLQYDGTANRKIFVSVSGSLHGSNGDEIRVAVAKGGTQITSSTTQITTTGAGNVLPFSCQCIVEMATNEYVELFVNNTSSTNAVTFDFFNICAYALI